MSNVVRVPPWKFHRTLNDAIEDELNDKLANKVFLNVGLCISLFDITKLGDSYILPGDGSSHTKVEFRYVVFRPFIDEVLVGKIRSCSSEGVQVTLDFFDDILIPPQALQHPSRFDDTEQAWVWEYDVGEGEKHDLFMDPGEKIRFKITSEAFEETCPILPDGKEIPKIEDLKDNTNKVPYKLTATINEPGLGLLTWWAKS